MAATNLIDRRRECEVLDRLLADVLAGASRAIVLRGEAGVGKSALLDYLSDGVAGWQVSRAVGVDSEMQLTYNGIHQLCSPLLEHLERLPVPQRDALATVFGRDNGPAPDRFLVGLAVLTLFAEVAERQPLICVIDDAHWLDQTSAQIIGFVARRLLAERVALVCAARTGIGDHIMVGQPELLVEGLPARDARTLLLDNVHGPLDTAICERIVSECQGNPLALLELPRGLTASQLAGGFGLVGGAALPGRIEETFLRRLSALAEGTRSIMLIAAADPTGDPVVLWRAAQSLGIDTSAVAAGETDGLLEIAAQVQFRHPLVRSAVYRAASPQERRAVHLALAEATDHERDPDRRAWHLATAAAAPDEEVAVELERSADRAQARGGFAAAAAFLQRAVALTLEPSRRAKRAVAAARASQQAGEFETALALLTTAESGPLDEYQHALVDLLRGDVAYASGFGDDAPRLLLNAARRLERHNLDLARETYLNAWGAAIFAGGDVLLEICHAALDLPAPPERARPPDLLLNGLALLITEGHAAAVPILKRATVVLAGIPPKDVLQWGWAARAAHALVWDLDGMRATSLRQVQFVRESGALAQLPLHLAQLALTSVWMGDFTGAIALNVESESVAAVTGSQIAPYTLLRIRSLQGSEADVATAIAGALRQAEGGGQGMAATWAHWAEAVLFNGLARYAEAFAEAGDAVANPLNPWMSMWALPELIEAAVRTGELDVAQRAFERLTTTTHPCGTDFASGIEARCRALLVEGGAADDAFRQAIERLTRAQLRPDLARARLLYGEQQRREGRRLDAREQLRAAHEMFVEMRMEAFAERARRELVATGAKARKRSVDAREKLTPQEEQIARLARDGFTNPEIAATLFLSARTVEWHLRKVFAKLGISSRRGLRAALPKGEHEPTSA
jgi:DNA-binding NarL/FixJ family response regulator